MALTGYGHSLVRKLFEEGCLNGKKIIPAPGISRPGTTIQYPGSAVPGT